MRCTVFIFLLLASLGSSAQKKTATVSGKIIDENENRISDVNIIILGKQNGIIASDSGTFHIIVPSEKAFALVFSHTGFYELQKNFYLSEGENEYITVMLKRNNTTLEPVIIKNDKERNETGLIKINPQSAQTLPGATGGVEGLIKNTCG